MPILSLESLPWILLAIVVVRSIVTAGRLAVIREQLAETHERLREAMKRNEMQDAVRVALEVVRRDAPQRADNFTKMS